jgi:acyl-CoA thioester hydrolase
MTQIDIPVSVRWADLDAYGHVNNAAMLTLLEEARIGAFWASDEPHPGGPTPADSHRTALLESGPQAATLTLIARQEVEYLLPIEYTRAPIVVRLWLSHIGGASIDVSYEVLIKGTLHAVALSTIVLVDAASGRPRRITGEERAAWERHLAPAVTFRHRR